MNQDYFRKIATTVILILLIVLAIFLLRPLLLSIVAGIILAFIFAPIYKWSNKYIKSKNLLALLFSICLVLLIILPVIFLALPLLEQAIKIYLASEHVDIISLIGRLFPILTASEIPIIIQSLFDSSISRMLNSLTNFLSIDNLVNYSLKSFVVLFTFFFALRDKEQIILYVKRLLPFSKETEKKLFERSRGITSSVIYGQVVVGILQGIIAGIGFFIFGVPNALFFTLLASIAGILPILGTALVWVPIAIFLLVGGNTFSAIGVVIIGLFASTIDNLIRPLIVSKKTKMHPAVVLIGMIGGLFLFGVLGLILGPLILAYLIIIVEIYKNQRTYLIYTKQ